MIRDKSMHSLKPPFLVYTTFKNKQKEESGKFVKKKKNFDRGRLNIKNTILHEESILKIWFHEF